jgi:hypothetical protein
MGGVTVKNDHKPPNGPWQTVGSDLFMWNNEDYLVIVDYYSKCFEVSKLENARSKTVIMHMKSAFARHGIPFEVKSRDVKIVDNAYSNIR